MELTQAGKHTRMARYAENGKKKQNKTQKPIAKDWLANMLAKFLAKIIKLI